MKSGALVAVQDRFCSAGYGWYDVSSRYSGHSNVLLCNTGAPLSARERVREGRKSRCGRRGDGSYHTGYSMYKKVVKEKKKSKAGGVSVPYVPGR